MVKCLNIGKPIYRSISSHYEHIFRRQLSVYGLEYCAAHQGLKYRSSVLDSGSTFDSISMRVNAVHEVIPTRVLEKLEHKLTFNLCSTRNNLSVLKHNRNTSPGAIYRIIVKAKQRPGKSPHSQSGVVVVQDNRLLQLTVIWHILVMCFDVCADGSICHLV